MRYSDRRYQRTPIPEEPPEVRQHGFEEVLHPYTREKAIKEANRCLQCALPFCVEACPIAQDCRGYVGLIASGRFDDAARVVLRANPLGLTLCKVCYHFCEDSCIMQGRGTPVAIRQLKRAALEFGDSSPAYVPLANRQRRVAIVGAGPAGLMAAWELCLRGYSVTLFEKQPMVGGQVDAIPKYRLPSSELSRDLERFQNFDVSFIMETAGGTDFSPENLLRAGYDAVFIAIGASKATSPGLPGETLKGVHYALDLLLEVNRGHLPSLGKNILVVGGGDVAIDSVRSAVRLAPGAQVAMAYRRTREEAPAGEEEIREADPEGIEFRWLLSPVRILGTHHVEGVQFQPMQLGAPDRTGRRAVVPASAPPETIPCDTVILAIGQTADLTGFSPELGLKVGSKGWPEGTHPDGRTAVEGIFASGGRSVVHAMAAGTRAAEAIDAYLSQKEGRDPVPRPDPFGGEEPAERFPSGYTGPVWRP